MGTWIDALKAHERASDQIRAARLADCEQCEYLEQATCALCGCYVDYRAARRMQYCPDLPPRWTAEE